MSIDQVVIVGRDAPLWLSACVMQYALGPAGVTVTAIELPPQAQPADVCVTLPALEPLHTRLRIDEGRLLAATRGAFTLGRHFVDTSGRTPAFFHAHGSNGSRIDEKEFLPHWVRARREGLDAPFDEFSLTASAARAGRMLLPDAAIDRFGFTDYAYHLPAIPYAAWLRQLALRRGVRNQWTSGLEVRLDESGAIAELLLEGDRRITGDLFLDATGPDALLMKALGVGRESWRDAFVVDRVLSAHSAPVTPVPVYSEIRAHARGWLALAASQVCIHVQHAYSSEQAPGPADLAAAAGVPLQGVVVRERHPGRRLQAWERNCVSIGEAACVFDPMHFVDLHAVQAGLVHLLPLFPVQSDFSVERDEYNQNVRLAFERLRDFQSAHYRLNRFGLNRFGLNRFGLNRDGQAENSSLLSSFWARSRATPASAALLHKIDVFRARGENVDYEDEAFTIDEWQSLFIGHGVVPESYDPAVDRIAPDPLQSEFARIRGFIRQKVDEQRTHTDYLREVCRISAA
jgi:tryptophan halogenase